MKLGTPEILLLIVLAVLLFGGSRIAGLGKALGTSIKDFKNEMKDDKEEKKEAAGKSVEKDESDS